VVPVIFTKGNIRFSVHAKDHNPPHVHISAPDASLVVNIKTLEVLSATGLRMKDISALIEVVKNNQTILLTEWERYHE
jgi:hypothetical protein